MSSSSYSSTLRTLGRIPKVPAQPNASTLNDKVEEKNAVQKNTVVQSLARPLSTSKGGLKSAKHDKVVQPLTRPSASTSKDTVEEENAVVQPTRGRRLAPKPGQHDDQRSQAPSKLKGLEFKLFHGSSLRSFHNCSEETSRRYFKSCDSYVFYEVTRSYPTISDTWAWVLCSPNSSWVPPAPPTLRSLRLRVDGRFGYDDPLLWPQPITPGNEYLACIERRGANVWADLWHSDLGEGDWKELAESPGVFQTSQELAFRLVSGLEHLWRHFRECESRFNFNILQPLRRLETATRTSISRLQRARETTAVLQYLWVLASRYVLETSAYMDYHTLFSPRLTIQRLATLDATRIGGIARTEEIVDEFNQMGIPVWVLRPLKSMALFESKMKYCVTPASSNSIRTDVSLQQNATLGEFDAWSDAYLSILHDWARYTPIGAPVTSVASKSSSSTAQQPVTSTTGSKRKRSRKSVTTEGKGSEKSAKEGKRPEKSAKRKQEDTAATAGNNKAATPVVKQDDNITDDMREALFPIVPKFWEAHVLLNASDKPGQDRRYFAPDPSLFRSCNSRDRLAKYTTAWFIIRPHWLPVLRKALASGSPPENSTTKNWKALFMGIFVASRKPATATATSAQRYLLANDMGLDELPYFDPEKFPYNDFNTGVQRSPTRLVNIVTYTEYERAVWDLHELNWRADFAALHRKLSPAKNPLWISPLIAATPVMMASSSGWGIFTDDAEESIVNFSTEFDGEHPQYCKDRARGLLSVCKFMASWVPVAPVSVPVIDDQVSFNGLEYKTLEKYVAAAYCRVFRSIRNRNPIPPAQFQVPSEDGVEEEEEEEEVQQQDNADSNTDMEISSDSYPRTDHILDMCDDEDNIEDDNPDVLAQAGHHV